jgi:Skp family chaperone for outer membrane proteins
MNLSKRNAGKTMALVLCLAGMMGAMGRVAQAQQVAIGVVDEDKLAQGYEAYKKAAAVLDKRVQDLDAQLESRQFMNEAEGRQFDALVVKTARGAGDDQALKSTVDAGMKRRAEYSGLLPKAVKTAAETARIKELEGVAKNNQAPFRKIYDELYNKIKKDQEDTDQKYTKQANDVIAQVAASKKLALVVRQRAVVWSAPAIDITNDVLTRLNKA